MIKVILKCECSTLKNKERIEFQTIFAIFLVKTGSTGTGNSKQDISQTDTFAVRPMYTCINIPSSFQKIADRNLSRKIIIKKDKNNRSFRPKVEKP